MPQVALRDFVMAARSGESVLSFPTDTVPALAARPDRADLIFAVKQRSQTKPLILMGGRVEDLWPFVTGSPDEMQIWQTVATRHFPGALTLVLPASDRLPKEMNPMDPTTIGIRVPNCAIACHILVQTGPLATTSANVSGHPPLETLADIEAQFPDVVTLLPSELEAFQPASVEKNYTGSGVPSTVAKWMGDRWEILRQGSVQLVV